MKGVRLRCRRPHEEEVAELKGLREGPDFPGLTRDHEILVHLSVRPARLLLTRIPVQKGFKIRIYGGLPARSHRAAD